MNTTRRSGYYETWFEQRVRRLSDRCRKFARRLRYSNRGETGIRWWLETLADRLVWWVICRAWSRSR